MAEVEVGKMYEGPVVKLLDFGALVNILPGKDGLLHISQISHERIANVADHLKEGQVVKVKVLELDDKGRMRLSMKALVPQLRKPLHPHLLLNKSILRSLSSPARHPQGVGRGCKADKSSTAPHCGAFLLQHICRAG